MKDAKLSCKAVNRYLFLVPLMSNEDKTFRGSKSLVLDLRI